MKYHGKIAASTPCFCHTAIDIFRPENTSKLPMRLQSVIGKGARSMVFSRDRDIQHEQKIFSAMRESLLQDPRIARLGGNPCEDLPPIKLIERPAVVQGEVIANDIPSTPKVLMDNQNPLERPAVAQGELITSDSPSTAPNAIIDYHNPPERPAVVSDSPSTAPNALVDDRNPRPVRPQSEENSSDVPNIAPDAPSILPSPKRSISKSEEETRDRPSAAYRLFRTGACGFIITIIVGSAFAWQSSDDTKKEMVKGWVNSLVRSSSLLSDKLPPESDVEAVSTTPTQPQSGAMVILTPSSEQPTPTTTATQSSSDLQKQLESIVDDLAIVRRIVEQVASRQDQMAQDIATLQEAQQNVSPKITAPPQSPIIRARPRRKR
jgi:hypothetical protein